MKGLVPSGLAIWHRSAQGLAQVRCPAGASRFQLGRRLADMFAYDDVKNVNADGVFEKRMTQLPHLNLRKIHE